MHTNVVLTNKRRIHTQPNYTNAKLKAWFGRLLRHPARKRSRIILNRHTPGPTQGEHESNQKRCGELQIPHSNAQAY